MKKKIKYFIKSVFAKRIINEQKVFSIIKKAHRKEQKLLDSLLEKNCDYDYIAESITECMKQEILMGINAKFPGQKVYFDNVTEEETDNSQQPSTELKEESTKDKKRFEFPFFKKTKKEENSDALMLSYKEETDEQPNYLPVVVEEPIELPKESEYWIINPLSGYKNDKKRIPNYTTSLCLVKNGTIYMSAVFDWYRKDLYYAIKGKGAYLNNITIRSSQTDKLSDSIIAFRIGSRGLNDNVELQKALTPLTLTMQSFSNVAVEMCFVASGKIDACVDVAVSDILNYKIGKLIVEEAGGVVTDFMGKEFVDNNSILASNKNINGALLKVVNSKLVSSTIKKAWKITKTALKFIVAII